MSAQYRTALVADDHALFRAGVAAMLRRDLDFSTVVEAASFGEAMDCLRAAGSDFGLVSFELPMPGLDRPDKLQEVRDRFPNTRVTVLSAFTARKNILEAIGVGIHGYIPKVLQLPEIVRAFQLILDGHVYLPSSVADCNHLPAHQGMSFSPVLASAPKLTVRQGEVVRLIAQGKSNKYIARHLQLAEGTVKVHVNALYRTLGVNNRVSAVNVMKKRDLDVAG